MDEQRKILPQVFPINMVDCEKLEAIDRENEDLIQLCCEKCSDKYRCILSTC